MLYAYGVVRAYGPQGDVELSYLPNLSIGPYSDFDCSVPAQYRNSRPIESNLDCAQTNPNNWQNQQDWEKDDVNRIRKQKRFFLESDLFQAMKWTLSAETW